ncbi:thioredoxin [Malacoplasma penetrans]|uniref:thioredoxin family protein n=1 Tax=Malacoplasma penetrans TaxID=28227 RepID=UPI0010115641|nr:thioredoxin family protein [Malacoplasma penetrans]RXY96975.1 thioredoxin [Malacoplasma penetrans]
MSSIKIGKDSNIETLINQTNITVVKYGATWCGPCKMLAPVLEKLADEMGDVTFVDVDVDDDDAEMTVKSSEVSSVPLMVFYKNGQPVNRVLGFRPEEEIVRIIESL